MFGHDLDRIIVMEINCGCGVLHGPAYRRAPPPLSVRMELLLNRFPLLVNDSTASRMPPGRFI